MDSGAYPFVYGQREGDTMLWNCLCTQQKIFYDKNLPQTFFLIFENVYFDWTIF